MNKRICEFEGCTQKTFLQERFCSNHSCWECKGMHLRSTNDEVCQTCQLKYPPGLVTQVLKHHNLNDKQARLNVTHVWYDRILFRTLLTLYNEHKSISDDWSHISSLQCEATQRRKAVECVQNRFSFCKSDEEGSDSDSSDTRKIVVECPTCHDEFVVHNAIWS